MVRNPKRYLLSCGVGAESLEMRDRWFADIRQLSKVFQFEKLHLKEKRSSMVETHYVPKLAEILQDPELCLYFRAYLHKTFNFEVSQLTFFTSVMSLRFYFIN